MDRIYIIQQTRHFLMNVLVERGTMEKSLTAAEEELLCCIIVDEVSNWYRPAPEKE